MLFTSHFLLAFLATVSVASHVPSITTPGLFDLNPPLSVVHNYLHLRAPVVPQSQEIVLTNAERLRIGLPLRKPAPKRAVARAASSAVAVATAAYPAATPATSKYDRGFVQMLNAESGNVVGFVSRTFNEYGQYGASAKDYDRLLVFINLAEAMSGGTEIITVNGPDVNFPSFGPITGSNSTSSNLEAGSSNYAQIGGLRSTPKGSPPVIQANSFTAVTGISRTAQSTVWTYDSESGFLSPHWINTDLTEATLYSGRIQEQFIVTADRDAFARTYGPTEWIMLQFVPL